MNDLILFDNPDEVRFIRLYLTRSGQVEYLIRSELIDDEGKCHRAEKHYRSKQLSQMRTIVQRLTEKLSERGIEKKKININSILMTF